MIRTERLTRKFGKKTAVDNLSIHVPAGRIALLLGPNGAGKSTTLRMLIGLLSPSSGSAEVAGIAVAKDPMEVKRRVGCMPEEWGFLEFLSGREYLELVADMRGMNRAESSQRIKELLERLELTDAPGIIRSYSAGMKQRIGLAAAIIHRPAVLLLDEPTANLDPYASAIVARILRSVRARGGTVLLSTHLIGDAEKIADDVYVMKDGALVASGTIEEVAAAGGGDLQAAYFKFLGQERLEEWDGVA